MMPGAITRIDAYLKDHVNTWVTNGRALIVEVSQGEKYIQPLEGSGRDQFISRTKRCAEPTLKIADILEKLDGEVGR